MSNLDKELDRGGGLLRNSLFGTWLFFCRVVCTSSRWRGDSADALSEGRPLVLPPLPVPVPSPVPIKTDSSVKLPTTGAGIRQRRTFRSLEIPRPETLVLGGCLSMQSGGLTSEEDSCVRME